MDENIKRHINIYKFIFFPWGIFTTTPIWFGVVKALEWLCSGIKENVVPSWIWIVLFFTGELAIVLFLFLYPRTLPKRVKNYHNFYVLVYPENFDDDKYINNDFVSEFKSHAGGIKNLNIIVPSVVKRQFFNKRVEQYNRRGKNYWDSQSWKKLHKKLGGNIYISGSLSRRISNKKEHYVFKLTATIGYNDINKALTPIMIAEMKLNFPHQMLIDKEFEFEQFNAFTDRFATFTEYLIGWSHLVSGNILIAYDMHKDIFGNNKQSFFNKGHLKDLRGILHLEAISVLRECKKFPKNYVNDCSQMLLKLFPNDSEALITIARCLIMTSTSEDIKTNVGRALQLISKVRVNKDNRAVYHANKAYLLLLSNKYEQADEEYKIMFRKPVGNVLENIVEYCDEQIVDGTEYERPTAYYVKVLMLSKSNGNSEKLSEAYDEAINNIPSGHIYQTKLKSIQTNHIVHRSERKNKKNRKRNNSFG